MTDADGMQANDGVELIWDEFEEWLQRNQPREVGTLGSPASEADIDNLEAVLGREIPGDLRRSLLRHDGTADSSLRTLYTDHHLLSAAEIAVVWKNLKSLSEEIDFEWWKASYLPVTASGSGDNCCIDLDADETSEHRMFVWYHDDPDGPALGTSYTSWLRMVVDDYIQAWDLNRLDSFGGHSECVEEIDWSSDGSRILSVGDYCAARLWDANTGQAIADIDDVPTRTFFARFAPDGQRFAVASSYLRIFETDRPQDAALSMSTPRDWYSTHIAWLPDGDRIAALTSAAVEVWDANAGRLIASTSIEREELQGERTMAVSPDGTAAIVVSNSAMARIALDTDSPTIERVVETNGARMFGFDVDWSPDSAQVALTQRETVLVIDGQTLQVVDTLSPAEPQARFMIWSARWSPDGNYLAAAGDKCRVWAVTTGAQVAEFQDEPLSEPGHSTTLAWDPSGTKLATGDVAGRLRVWPLHDIDGR